MVKVFVSHHNTDKGLLAEVGERMRHYGFDLFLAHDAIRVGEDDLKAIKENLTDCQLFFAYGSERAMASAACNQEIGVALGLEKPYILALMPDLRPWGILPSSQAIRIQGDITADELFHRLLSAIANHPASLDIPNEYVKNDKEEKLKAMVDEEINAFVIAGAWRDSASQGSEVITLQPTRHEVTEWDGRYEEDDPTEFSIVQAGVTLGTVDIVCDKQTQGQSVQTYLPAKFPFLGCHFLSGITYEEVCREALRKAISCLLNDRAANAHHDKQVQSLDKTLRDIICKHYVHPASRLEGEMRKE